MIERREYEKMQSSPNVRETSRTRVWKMNFGCLASAYSFKRCCVLSTQRMITYATEECRVRYSTVLAWAMAWKSRRRTHAALVSEADVVEVQYVPAATPSNLCPSSQPAWPDPAASAGPSSIAGHGDVKMLLYPPATAARLPL